MNAPGMVDIGGVLYRRLTVADLIEFSEKVWHEQRRQLLDDLDAAHVSDAARAEAVYDHGTRRNVPDYVSSWAWKLDGMRAIIERAAKNMNLPAPDLDSLGPVESGRAAYELSWGIDFEEERERRAESARGKAKAAQAAM